MPKSTVDIETFVDLTRDARARGISGSELHRALGDIDDYLTEQYRRACDQV
jgi:hypothetical protein